jgi:hypothetical protein
VDVCASPKKYAETQYPALEPLQEWMDGVKRIALSSDKVPILVHIPQGFLSKTEVCAPDSPAPVQRTESICQQAKLFEAIQQYGKAVGPTVKRACADKHGRDQAASYIHKTGELCGIVKLVTGWHAIGHRVCTVLFSSSFSSAHIEMSVFSMKMK